MVDYCTTSAAQLDCESLIKCNLLHLNAALLQLCLENSFIYLFLSSLSTLHSSLLCPCLIVMRQIYVLLSASERSCRKLPPYRFSCNNSARRRSLFLHTHFDTFIHLLSYQHFSHSPFTPNALLHATPPARPRTLTAASAFGDTGVRHQGIEPVIGAALHQKQQADAKEGFKGIVQPKITLHVHQFCSCWTQKEKFHAARFHLTVQSDHIIYTLLRTTRKNPYC